jgi:hypothetical protein
MIFGAFVVRFAFFFLAAGYERGTWRSIGFLPCL